MPRLILLLALALALCQTGCYVSRHEINTQIPTRVPAGTPIAVVQPPDASFATELYEKSGQELAGKLVGALTPYYPGSTISYGESSSGYVIRPQILHWEERATEWSGRPDKVQVSLPLYHSGRLVGSAMITASSSWWTLGGDHAEGLLTRPFEIYAARLAGKQIKDMTVKQIGQ